MKYLIDEALIVESVIQEEIDESTGKKEKNYYIEGIFSTPDQKNRNGRIYPLSLWEREVEKYQNEIKNNTIKTLGEWEHPSRTSVDPIQAVIKIIELKIEDGVVKGKAKILNDNSEKTNKLKALIDEGMKIGVSSRGTGSVKGDYVESFNLTTYDAVSSPSDYNANLTGLCESLETSVKVEEKEIIQKDQDDQEIQENVELTEIEKGAVKGKFLDKFSEILKDLKSKDINEMKENNDKIKFQLELNQIFNPKNIKSMLEIADRITDKKDKYLLKTYLELIKTIGVKENEKVKLVLEKSEK